jgi:hypothetical protein
MSPAAQPNPAVSMFHTPNATTAISPAIGMIDLNLRVNAKINGLRTRTHTYARKYHIAEVNHWLAMREVGCPKGKKNVHTADVRT